MNRKEEKKRKEKEGKQKTNLNEAKAHMKIPWCAAFDRCRLRYFSVLLPLIVYLNAVSFE